MQCHSIVRKAICFSVSVSSFLVLYLNGVLLSAGRSSDPILPFTQKLRTMAEALGVAASVAGIAGVAVQITETVIKLRRLYSNIKNGPSEIASLVDDIAVTGSTLSYMNSRHAATGSPPIDLGSFDQCHQRCKSALGDLNEIVQLLEQRTRRGRIAGSLEIFLRKDTIATL